MMHQKYAFFEKPCRSGIPREAFLIRGGNTLFGRPKADIVSEEEFEAYVNMLRRRNSRIFTYIQKGKKEERMRKKAKISSSASIVLAMLFSAAFLTPVAVVEGESKVVAVEGMSYNVNSSMADNLKSLIGKNVCVNLNSGKTFIGFVKEVGNHLIHLEKLQGKDYFDALICIEDISAIDTRFWKIQR
jgi:hypothetical protein